MTRLFYRVVLLLTLFSLCLLSATQPALAQEKSLVWDRFDVDITVNKDG